jgi:hypothetical protein
MSANDPKQTFPSSFFSLDWPSMKVVNFDQTRIPNPVRVLVLGGPQLRASGGPSRLPLVSVCLV